jgi:acetolactate synthase small subunit
VLDRVTFEIQANNRPEVLPRVVLIFHRLNIEIQGLHMVRRPGSETMRISVTIQANRNDSGRIEANLYKLVYVRSVKNERATKEALRQAWDYEVGPRSRL